MIQHPPAPTLLDVATKAGVSTATVSRCLNFPDRLALETREKVMHAVKELGYSPNFGARALAANRTMTIGAIIPTMENAVFARGLQAFQETLRDKGFTLLVACSSYLPEVEEEQIRALVARGADALLLIGHERDPAIYSFLQAQNVPALVTWAYDRTVDRMSVGFDNQAAMKAMALEVLGLGHQRLGMISAPIATNDRAAARLNGIKSAMQEAGLAPADLQVTQTPYSIENGALAFQDMMQKTPPPTAVFCGNDVLAVGALGQARAMGIAVPDTVSIVGFDDIELAQVTYPTLATVHVPHRDMGKRAAEVLIEMLQGTAFSTSIELQSELKLRQSLGPARV